MASELVLVEREKRKAAREAREWEREKLILDVVLSPPVVRTALAAGIIAYSTWATRSEHNVGPVHSALAFALPGIGLPLLAADAGITDKYALGAISAAGLTYAGLSAAQGMPAGTTIESFLGAIPIVGPTLADWYPG